MTSWVEMSEEIEETNELKQVIQSLTALTISDNKCLPHLNDDEIKKNIFNKKNKVNAIDDTEFAGRLAGWFEVKAVNIEPGMVFRYTRPVKFNNQKRHIVLAVCIDNDAVNIKCKAFKKYDNHWELPLNKTYSYATRYYLQH